MTIRMGSHKIWSQKAADSFDDYDAVDWIEFFEAGRRTREGLRFDYDRNHNGRHHRKDRRGGF